MACTMKIAAASTIPSFFKLLLCCCEAGIKERQSAQDNTANLSLKGQGNAFK